MTTYLLAGGGTGGHVNPLLALAGRIRQVEPTATIIALGTAEGLEAKLVPERGFELIKIEKLPFPRTLNRQAFKFPLRFQRAVKSIRKVISDRGVDVVVGFGGYASAPAYVAAQKSSIPYVIHEANALPGLANKLAASKAAAVATAFSATKLPKAQLTGMPLRQEIEDALGATNKKKARLALGLDPDLTTILVTGGSLGARSINTTIASAESSLNAAGFQVLHVVGNASDLNEVSSKYLTRIKYCDRMDLAIAAADLAIARAGASTVCEFGAMGLPSILIPYPVGNGEQRFNAKELVGAGGALLVEDADFTLDFVRDQVIALVSNKKTLTTMSAAAKASSISDGTQRLFELVRSVLPRNTQKRK